MSFRRPGVDFGLATCTLALLLQASVVPAATLIGFATLPADTFVPGPSSGQFIEAANGRQPPFADRQPVQGFSALIDGGNGSFLILSDNGFGSRANSPDYLLSIYHVNVDFRTEKGGQGSIRVDEVINLSDPKHHLPYPVVRTTDRLLTGADLDPESFRKLADGSYWIGEEFNPSLLHVDARGILLAPPYLLAGLWAVDNPRSQPATLPRSRGFEGMAISPDGNKLYPMLEGGLLLDDGEEVGIGLNIYTFDHQKRQFLNTRASRPSHRYRLDGEATAIGDFTLFSATGGLVIERDSQQGADAVLKKIYKVDFTQIDTEGFLRKTLVADLLEIADPHDLDLDGKEFFRFPFKTIEGLLVIDRTTLGIVNDNNYPFGQAGRTQQNRPDDSEFILLEVTPLWD